MRLHIIICVIRVTNCAVYVICNALCVKLYALRVMSAVICVTCHALCFMFYALCVVFV